MKKQIKSNKINNKESSRLAQELIDIHLTEYSHLRDEIIMFLSHRATALNYSLIISAALATILPTLVSKLGSIILLLAAIPYLGLTWYSTSTDKLIARVGGYLRLILIPKINSLLIKEYGQYSEIAANAQLVFEWESHAENYRKSFLKYIVSSLTDGGQTILILLPAILMVFLFIYETKIAHSLQWTMPEHILFWSITGSSIALNIMWLYVKHLYSATSYEDVY